LFGKTPLKAQNDCFLKIWGVGHGPSGYVYDANL